jgi:hypothetical protein
MVELEVESLTVQRRLKLRMPQIEHQLATSFPLQETSALPESLPEGQSAQPGRPVELRQPRLGNIELKAWGSETSELEVERRFLPSLCPTSLH